MSRRCGIPRRCFSSLGTVLAVAFALPSVSSAAECTFSSYVPGPVVGTPITYFIKNSVPSSTWIDRIRDGADSWNTTNNNCGFSDLSTPSRQYGGTSSVGWDPGDGLSRIDFGAVGNLPNCPATALACTLHNTNTHDFDMRFNTATYTFSTIGNGCGSYVDVWSVAAHEFGHTLRLEHVSDSEQTMVSSIVNGQCFPRSLGRSDILGMRALY